MATAMALECVLGMMEPHPVGDSGRSAERDHQWRQVAPGDTSLKLSDRATKGGLVPTTEKCPREDRAGQ